LRIGLCIKVEHGHLCHVVRIKIRAVFSESPSAFVVMAASLSLPA
jgi:hypothetical protein